MKNRLLNASFAYAGLGLASGLFYRELTKTQQFPAGQYTQLSIIHTHLLTLGFMGMLIALALEHQFGLSNHRALFRWWLVTYNAGVVITAAMMTWHGTLTVLGRQVTPMISGIAGLGHILLTASIALLYALLRATLTDRNLTEPRVDAPATGPHAA